MTASDVSALAGLNVQASVIVVEQSGHMVPWDNLHRCLEVISQVLTPA